MSKCEIVGFIIIYHLSHKDLQIIFFSQKKIFFHHFQILNLSTMGKPSKASRKNDANRLQRRRQRNNFFLKRIKQKEGEVSDLQIEVQKLRQFIEGAGEKVIYEFNKLHHDQNDLLKWINLYVEQIKDLEKEIYLLNLKSYVH